MTIFQADSLAILAELDQFEMVTKADQQDRGRVKWLSKTKKYLISFAFLNRLVSVPLHNGWITGNKLAHFAK